MNELIEYLAKMVLFVIFAAFATGLAIGVFVGWQWQISHDFKCGVRYAVIQHGACMALNDHPANNKWGWKDYRCNHDWYSDSSGGSHNGNSLFRIPCPNGCGMMDGVDICRHCGAIFPYGKGRQDKP